jgi:hypothetical protein
MKFYCVHPGFATQFFDGEYDPYPDLDELVFGASPLPGLEIEIVRGTRPGDMIFAAFNAVSHRFTQVLEECRATGWSAYPVAARLMKTGTIVAEYQVLKLLGVGGPLRYVSTQVVGDDYGTRYSKVRGVFMDESKWDGSDVFAIPGMGIHIFVSERVTGALRKAKLKNVRIVPNDEYEHYADIEVYGRVLGPEQA